MCVAEASRVVFAHMHMCRGSVHVYISMLNLKLCWCTYNGHVNSCICMILIIQEIGTEDFRLGRPYKEAGNVSFEGIVLLHHKGQPLF